MYAIDKQGPVYSEVKSLSHVRLFATPWTVTYQAPLSIGFPGKNTGVSCHFLLEGIFLTQGLNPGLLCLLHGQVGFLSLAPPGSPMFKESLFC